MTLVQATQSRHGHGRTSALAPLENPPLALAEVKDEVSLGGTALGDVSRYSCFFSSRRIGREGRLLGQKHVGHRLHPHGVQGCFSRWLLTSRQRRPRAPQPLPLTVPQASFYLSRPAAFGTSFRWRTQVSLRTPTSSTVKSTLPASAGAPLSLFNKNTLEVALRCGIIQDTRRDADER